MTLFIMLNCAIPPTDILQLFWVIFLSLEHLRDQTIRNGEAIWNFALSLMDLDICLLEDKPVVSFDDSFCGT